MKKLLTSAAIFLTLGAISFVPGVNAATPGGGLTIEMIQKMRDNYKPTAAERALANAAANNALDKLAATGKQRDAADTYFSHEVPGKGITDQKSSGRCWLFTGLNVLRSQMMKQHNLPEFKLSQNYNFFYDQLEKANLFLQSIIDSAGDPLENHRVQWLLSNPLSDGGQFTGLSDNISKYGVVPAEVMGETFSAENTSRMSTLVKTLLRKDAMELRRMYAGGSKPGALQERKQQMLGDVYRMLAMTLGEPPTEFTWTRKDKDGKPVSTKTYTPQSFYKEFAGNDLQNGYVMLMNDPSRPFWKLYEIDLDRHTYDGKNWTYVNLPVEEIKKMAIASIKDSTMMYFSCDVGKSFDRQRGVLDLDVYDYDALMGVDMQMDKADRIRSHASASSHAMTLMAVDLDADGKPVKWKVENSWGPGANSGHLIMTDPWFDEYMFRLVVERRFVPEKVLEVLKQKPTMLPAWDILYYQED